MLALAKDILQEAGIAFKGLSVIQMIRSSGMETRLALFIFVDEKKDPLAILKLTPDLEEAKFFEHEFENLSLLNAHGDPQFIVTIPKPLYFGRSKDFTTLAETAMPGTRMKNFPPNGYFSSNRFQLHFANVVQWLYGFHQCVAGSQTEPASLDNENQLSVPIEEYQNTFRLSSELDSLLKATMECLEQADIPMTPWHRDFCTANVLVNNAQQISIIDWEHPLIRSWPLLDLLYFITSIWCIPYKKGKNSLVNNYRRLFFTQNRHTSLIRKSVSGYMQRLGVKTEYVLCLSVIAWVLYANGKRRCMEARKKASGTGSRDPESFPLIMVENNQCLNLEILAKNLQSYVLNSL